MHQGAIFWPQGVYSEGWGAYGYGMSDYDRRNTSQTTETSSSSGTSDSMGLEDAATLEEVSNEERQRLLKVSGNLGRAFNRIAGVSESNTDPAGVGFGSEDLKRYLEHELKFAEGEWFRSAKIGGVADKVMETLDANKDGNVDWVEFQTMVEELKSHMIGELGPGAGTSEIQAKANELFAEVSGGGDSVGFERLQSQTESKLPEDAEHKGLISQLAALLVIDLVDIDEANKEVRDRTVSHEEWMGAVNEFSQ